MTKDTSCIITHSKVWVVAGRSELVASHDKEDKSGNLIKVAVKVWMLYGWRQVNRRTSLNMESNHSYWKGTVILSRYTMILNNNSLYIVWRTQSWWSTLWSRRSRRPWCRSAWTASAFPSSQQPCHQLKKHPSMIFIHSGCLVDQTTGTEPYMLQGQGPIKAR